MIKGVAILFMILHHVLIQEYWIIENAPVLSRFEVGIGSIFKICVGIYAFITGYTYLFVSNKNLRYSLKKIFALLSRYWLQLVLIFIPFAIVGGGYKISFPQLLTDIFGITPNLNCLSWYIYFYVFCMALLPIVAKLPNIANLIFLFIVLPICSFLVDNLLDLNSYTIFKIISECLFYFQFVTLGYITAKFSLFGKIGEKIKIPKMIWLLIAGLALVVKRLSGHFIGKSIFGFNQDIVIVFILILALSTLLRDLKLKIVSKPLESLGKYSTAMWFFHATFFTPCTTWFFQPILSVFRFSPIIYIMCVVISFIVGVGLELLYKSIVKIPILLKKKKEY